MIPFNIAKIITKIKAHPKIIKDNLTIGSIVAHLLINYFLSRQTTVSP